jgi:TetR/AcrR family transcriptional regulator
VSKSGRERDAEVAREAIMDAGETVFAQNGFNGARIDTIAAEAGYNKSLIFHYFEDKEGLYRAIIARLKSRMRNEFMEPLLAFVQSSDEMNVTRVRLFIEMAIDRYMTFLTHNPRNRQMMAWQAAEGWHIFMGEPKKDLEVHRATFTCCADFLYRAQQAHIIDPQLDVRFLFINVANCCIMYFLHLPRFQWMMGGDTDPLSPEALVYARQQILHLVLHGVFVSSIEGTE